MPTVQACLTDEILKRGVDTFFGVPGDFIIKYFNYLEKRSDVTLVRMNDETHAGSAADAYARIKGLGVVVATYAVGGFKLVNSLAQAYVESSPVLIVSGAPARSECGESSSILSYRVHHLVKDVRSQRRVFTEVTGRQEVIENVYTARSQIQGLLDYITSERMPGYIEIGRDLLDEKLPRRSIATHQFVHPPRLSDARALREAIDRSVRILNASKRPILWVGVEVQRLSLQEQVMRLSLQYGIPLVTSLFGKSAIDENFPNHFGIYAGAQTTSTRYDDKAVGDYFESADALLAQGVNASDFNFGLGTVRIDEEKTRIIMAVKDSIRIGTALYRAVMLEHFLDGLLGSSLTKHRLPKLPTEGPIKAMEPGEPLNSDLLFRILGDYVAENVIVISDIGDCLFGAGKLRTGYTGFLEPGVYGSMGWSVAASIGAKLADPALRPLVIVGDGALIMGQESAFAKLVELGVDAVILVMNNQGYATLQGTSPGSFNRIPLLNFERLTDYAGGGKGFRVTTVGELSAALQAVRSIEGEPVIINVVLPDYDKTTTLTRVSQALARGLKGEAEA